jgi:hypothetical protein
MDSMSSAYIVPSYQPATDYLKRLTFSIDRHLSISLKTIIPVSVGLNSIAVGLTNLAKSHKFSPQMTKRLYQVRTLAAAIGIGILLGVAVKWRHLFTYLIAAKIAAKFSRSLTQYGKQSSTMQSKVCGRGGKKMGELINHLDHKKHSLPILRLYTQNPYEMGYVQGYLLGDKIEDLTIRVIKPMILFFKILSQDWTGEALKVRPSQISIPEKYETEMQGLADGVKAHAKDHGYESHVTVEDIRTAHRLPDTYKAIGHHKLLGLFYPNTLGCSTAVIRKEGQMAIGRTLEWLGLELMGRCGILREHHIGSRKVMIQTFPGFIGALTSKNSDGLVVVINELSRELRKGVPYNLLARDLIENAANVEEAQKIIDGEDFVPASSHHVIMMDKEQARNLQFYATHAKYVRRDLPEEGYLVVTNHAVDAEIQVIEGSQGDITSEERFELMTKAIEFARKGHGSVKHDIRKALAAINTYNTIASAIYSSEIDDHGEHAFDSHYAASHLLKE